MKWFKFYGQDFLTDSKLGSLNPYQKLMWVVLLCIASQDEKKTGILEFLEEYRIMDLAGLDYESMDGMYGVKPGETLETFCNMKLVTKVTDTTYKITNYHQKQTQQATSTERVAAYRARKQATNSSEDETNVTLQSNGRVEENRIDKNRIEKSKYGEFENVLLTPEEHSKLIDALGETITNLLIGELSSYIESTGKRYRSHYATLQNWARRKMQEHKNTTIKRGKGLIT